MNLTKTIAVVVLPVCLLGAPATDQSRVRVRNVQRSASVARSRRSRSEDYEWNEVYGFGGADWQPTRDTRDFTLEVRILSRRQAVEECSRLGAWPAGVLPKREGGCALFYPDRQPVPHCVVIVPEPGDTDDAATLVLGHEVMHCVKGRYHQ